MISKNNSINFSESEIRALYPVYSDYDVDPVKICIQVACVISIIGCLIMFVTYFLFPEIRTTTRQLIIFLTFADFLTASGNLYGISVDYSDKSSADCIVQSFITTFSSMASFFWTVSIGCYLYISIVKMNFSMAENLIPVLHLINWGIPWTITYAAWLDKALGNGNSTGSVGWCWIKEGGDHQRAIFWMIVSGKFWEIFTALVLPPVYYFNRKHITRTAVRM